jgi:hypothetical protein
MKRRLQISILLLVSLITAMSGQDVKVTASFDTSRIYIGDQTGYTVTVEQPAGLALALKPLRDTLCKNIEILAGPLTDTTTLAGDRLEFRHRYLVTSFDSGMYAVAPYYAEISDKNGIRRFYSDYSFLEVARVKIAPQDTTARIFDIIKPYKAPVTIGEILPWALMVLAAAALIYGAVILFRKLRKKRKEPEVVINPDPAHVIAFRELEKLREGQLWQKGEVKLYYSRLTEIIRQYLENRYKVYSLEMTTSETLDALLKTGFRKDESYSNLKSVLTGADLVKFAKYKPEPVENEKYFDDAWQFVDTTRLREEATGENSSRDNMEVKQS